MTEQTIQVPVFDSATYQKVCSRIGRLKKSLTNKVKGSKKCTEVEETLRRAEKLKRRIIFDYLTELAKYCVAADIECSIHEMERTKTIPDDRMLIGIILDHWVRFRVKVHKFKTAGGNDG